MGFVGGVDVKGVGDAGGCYFYALAIFGGQGAIFEGGGKEVDDGQSETLFGVKSGRLDGGINGGTFGVIQAVLTMMALRTFVFAKYSEFCSLETDLRVSVKRK